MLYEPHIVRNVYRKMITKRCILGVHTFATFNCLLYLGNNSFFSWWSWGWKKQGETSRNRMWLRFLPI